MDVNFSKLQEIVKDKGAWRAAVPGVTKSQTQLSNSMTARRSNQSVLKEINPAYSLEGLMVKLKLQYSGHLM